MQKPKELLCLGHHLYEKSDMDAFLAELEKKHEEELRKAREEVGFSRELTGLEQRLYTFLDRVDDIVEYDLTETRWESLRSAMKQCKEDCRTMYGVVNNGYSLHIHLPFDIDGYIDKKPSRERDPFFCFNPKTVNIGGKVWMAENLKLSDHESGIYFNVENGECYYNWKAAKRVAAQIHGWHLPSRKEWDELVKYTGNDAANLRDKSWEGTDMYGFSAVHAGYWNNGFRNVGSGAYFWTSEPNGSYAWYRYIDTGTSVNENNYSQYYGFSVRLVKDSP